jgi:hypothetical protein
MLYCITHTDCILYYRCRYCIVLHPIPVPGFQCNTITDIACVIQTNTQTKAGMCNTNHYQYIQQACVIQINTDTLIACVIQKHIQNNSFGVLTGYRKWIRKEGQ